MPDDPASALAVAVLPVFDRTAAWEEYDTTARALPDCEHNQAWRDAGPGRPPPPDCEHNRPWRAAIEAAWSTYLAALDNDRPPGGMT